MTKSVSKSLTWSERWREHYNRVRPHSALGYRPLAPEIAAGPPSASLRAVQQRFPDRMTTA